MTESVELSDSLRLGNWLRMIVFWTIERMKGTKNCVLVTAMKLLTVFLNFSQRKDDYIQVG